MQALIRVRVTPRAHGSSIAGRSAQGWRIRIAAPPVDDRANAELVRFLAATLGVPRSSIRITGGSHSRDKTLRIEGISQIDAEGILRARLPG
jgi:uncharacterized protein